jgi:hypothetical protein
MRTLIVTVFITLDGVVEAPGGEPTHPHAGWRVPYGVPELYAYKLQETLEAESLLLGRITYQGFSAAWSQRKGEFADKMNAMPKHVVTTALLQRCLAAGLPPSVVMSTARSHRDTPSFGWHTFAAQPGQLLGGEMWRGRPVSAQYSVPRQVVAVLGEDATHQPGPARQTGAGGDLSVSEH